MGPMERGCSNGPLIRNSLILQKFIAQNKVQQRFIYCEQHNKVFYYVKKSNTLKVRQVANIRYCTGHSTSLQPVKSLKRLHRVMRDAFKEVCGCNLDN